MFKRNPKSPSSGIPTLKPARFRQRSSVTVLDIEGKVLRIAQASGPGAGARVTRVAEADLDLPLEKRDDPKLAGAAVRKALETAKIRPREVLFALPRGQVVLRPIEVPRVADVRELASLVNFQIAKDLPFRIEDAVVDFTILRAFESPPSPEADPATPPEQRLEVLVGAARKEIVEYYRALAREAKLKLEGLGLRPLGHSYFVRSTHPPAPDAAMLIVGLRTDETTLDIVDREKLVFSRVPAANFPANDGARSGFLQTLQIEAVRSLHGYAGASAHHPVKTLMVLGQTGLEQEVGEALGSRLGLPLEQTKIGGSGPDQAGAAAACGLALGALEPTGLSLDFENPKKPAPPSNPKRTQAIIAIAAGIVILVTLGVVRTNLVKKRLAVRQQVQTELESAKSKEPIYKRLKLQSKSVAAWRADEQSWLDHLAYLSAILPGADQIYVSAFTTTPQHLIRFSVQSKTGELLAELDKKLRAAGYEVKPLSITPANDKHGYNFRTTVELSVPKKMKPDLSKVKPPPRPADDTALNTASPSPGGRRS